MTPTLKEMLFHRIAYHFVDESYWIFAMISTFNGTILDKFVQTTPAEFSNSINICEKNQPKDMFRVHVTYISGTVKKLIGSSIHFNPSFEVCDQD